MLLSGKFVVFPFIYEQDCRGKTLEKPFQSGKDGFYQEKEKFYLQKEVYLWIQHFTSKIVL